MDNESPGTPAEPAVPAEPTSPPVVADATPTVVPAPPMSEPAPPPVQGPAPVPSPAQAQQPAPVAPTPPPPAAPAAAPESAPRPQTQSAAASANGPRRLLLVEDDDALANVYVMRLQTEGFDVRRVANGEEALSAALNYKPDLIILDVMMPKVSGFDVLDILRNTPETANVKIVMLTALSQDSDKERAQSLGVDDYLVKSQVVIADVIERIRHHLNMQ